VNCRRLGRQQGAKKKCDASSTFMLRTNVQFESNRVRSGVGMRTQGQFRMTADRAGMSFWRFVEWAQDSVTRDTRVVTRVVMSGPSRGGKNEAKTAGFAPGDFFEPFQSSLPAELPFPPFFFPFCFSQLC
jgi:hypothetical protein